MFGVGGLFLDDVEYNLYSLPYNYATEYRPRGKRGKLCVEAVLCSKRALFIEFWNTRFQVYKIVYKKKSHQNFCPRGPKILAKREYNNDGFFWSANETGIDCTVYLRALMVSRFASVGRQPEQKYTVYLASAITELVSERVPKCTRGGRVNVRQVTANAL